MRLRRVGWKHDSEKSAWVALAFDATQKAWVPSGWKVVVIGTDSGGRPTMWGVERDGVAVKRPASKRPRATGLTLTVRICRDAKDYVKREISGVVATPQVSPGSVGFGKAKVYAGPMPRPRLMVLIKDIENPTGNGHKDPQYDFCAAKVFKAGQRFVIEPMEAGGGWRPILKSHTRTGSASEGSAIWNLLMGSGHVVAAETSLDSVLVSGWCQRSHCDSIVEKLLQQGKIDLDDVREAMVDRHPKSDHHSRAELLARNGRWGTCAACPRRDGKVYPEECEFTTRSDHALTAENQ